MTGFLTHKWFKLLDEDGIPVSSATVFLYEYTGSTPTSADYLHRTDEDGLIDTTLPLTTDINGVFEFYVKDHIRAQYEAQTASGSVYGYNWDTKYVISWSNGSDKSGVIMGDNLFGEYESVITSGSNTSMNKAISNQIGKILQTHFDLKCDL